MAINPDPVGSFNSTFKVADDSRRGWEELEFRKQQLFQQQAREAVQQARQRKADDFNMMMKSLSEDRQQRNTEIDNTRADQQLRLSTFNADTSRYNALNPGSASRYSSDPLGLGGGSAGGSTGEGNGFSFGGKEYGPSWGAAHASVFGGPNDPDDNGLSAFGGKTGPGGREGVAIPEKILRQQLGDDESLWANAQVDVTLGDGSNHTLNVADKGTAEWVWDKKGGPVLDLTEGAVAQLGGNVVYDRNGKMRDVQGIDIKDVRVRGANAPSNRVIDREGSQEIPDANLFPVPEATVVAAQPPDLSAPEAVEVAPKAVVVPEAAPQAAAVASPPAEIVTNLGEQDVTQETKNTMFGLERDSLAQKKLAAIKQAQASRTAAYLARANLSNPAAYRELAEKQQAEAIDAAGAAEEAAAKADRLKAEMPKIEARQNILSSLADLDPVLPPADKAALVALAKSPASGGQADRQLAAMAAYSKVRSEYGLDYKSNGLKTAESVARTGANLYTKEALDDRQAYQSYTAATEALKDTDLDEGEAKAWRTEKVKNTAQAQSWMSRQKRFQEAVKADTLKEVKEGAEETPAPVKVVEEAPPAPRGLIDEANSAASNRNKMSQADQEKWSASKTNLREKVFGGREGIKQIIANAGGATTLAGLKGILTSALRDSSGGSDDFIGGRVSFPKGVIGPLPKNASSPLDVIDALAEDIWREDGRGPQSKATPNSKTLSAKGMDVLEAYQKRQ